MDASITVAVRLRPMNPLERAKGLPPCAQVDSTGSQLRLLRDGTVIGPSRFVFDHVYDADATQHHVYEDLGRPLVKQAFRGQTCIIFAHGATGSGKTHALTGSTLNPGISTRLFCEVFDTMTLLKQQNPKLRSAINVSYAEIYNHSVWDLLLMEKPSSRRNSSEPDEGRRRRSDTSLSVESARVPNLTSAVEFPVTSPEEMCRYKEHGEAVRKGRHLIGSSASLSHSVFSICIRHTDQPQLALQDALPGYVHIVDLASNNISTCLQQQQQLQNEPHSPEVLQAASAVDTSLSALCSALHTATTYFQSHSIHYSAKLRGAPATGYPRDLLLADLLRGRQWHEVKCVLLACISPSHTASDESLRTAEFASRCATDALMNRSLGSKNPGRGEVRGGERSTHDMRARGGFGHGDQNHKAKPPLASLSAPDKAISRLVFGVRGEG
jgi:hypothetical protein